jgi:two-component system nitrate/nitrite response regulator NarL
LIADHTATRAGIRIALGDAVEICAEADDARSAIAAAAREQPDVCIVGLELAGGGATAVAGICTAAPASAVVALAAAPDVEDLLALVRAGAVGYLPASIEPAAQGN